MKYAIVKCSNGSFTIESEWSDLTQAKAHYHSVCQTLWNASDVLTAEVMIADEQLNCVEGYREFIHHDPEPEPEPETEGTEGAEGETDSAAEEVPAE